MRKKRTRGDYPENEDAVKAQKVSINEQLCALLREKEFAPLDESNRRGLVLDAQSFQSCSALLAAGIAPSPASLIVPNPDDSMREALEARPDLKGLCLRQAYSGLLLARELAPASVALAYLDWTCTFAGSKRVKPANELNTSMPCSTDSALGKDP